MRLSNRFPRLRLGSRTDDLKRFHIKATFPCSQCNGPLCGMSDCIRWSLRRELFIHSQGNNRIMITDLNHILSVRIFRSFGGQMSWE